MKKNKPDKVKKMKKLFNNLEDSKDIEEEKVDNCEKYRLIIRNLLKQIKKNKNLSN